MICFLCGNNNFEEKYKLANQKILRCRNEGLFLAKLIKSSNINTYQKNYFDNPPHPLNANRIYFLKKLSAIQKLTMKSKPYILDVGCGWGEFEEVLQEEKIPYLGIDRHQGSIEICKQKGLNCKQSIIQQLNNKTRLNTTREMKNSFDAITMFQFIEHLQNPLSDLQTAKKLLKKNGVILITTPNNDSPLRKILASRWSVYNESSHYIFYNQHTLRKTLELAGFKKIKVKLDQIRSLSLNYIINRLNQIYPTSLFKFLASNFQPLTSNIPVITDPFGDLVATAIINYD